MKKLLIFMVVLGAASWANAELTLQVATGDDPCSGDYSDVGDEYDLNVNDTIWLGAYNDTQEGPGNTWKFAGYVNMAVTISAQWTGNDLFYKPPGVEGAPGNTYYGVYYGYDWWYTNWEDGDPTHYTGIGVVTGFELECLALGDVVVNLVDDDAITVLDSLTIHQVPEPMTLLLLGLGAVMLRRKRIQDH